MALHFGSLLRSVVGFDPEFDHVVDDMGPESYRDYPDEGSAVAGA